MRPSAILAFLVGFPTRFGRRRFYLACAAIVLLIGGYVFIHSKSAAVETPADTIRSVEVKSVSELASEASPLSIVGTVTSRSEATVRAESSGQVIGVYRALGDSVAAGTIVAELEDASQRAALLQAQGSVDAAEANLSKVKGGTRPEQLGVLQSALDGAKSAAVNALLAAYSSVDNSVRGGVDAMFFNPDGATPIFNVTASDSHLNVKIQNTRGQLGTILSRESGQALTLTNSDDLVLEIGRTETELRTLRDFLDDILQALNKSVPTATVTATNIATYQATTISARASVNTALSSISAARQTLTTAQKNMEQGVQGPQNQDVASAQAAVTQSQGSYAAAKANLEKAIIRAPISGTINSFDLKRGDYVQQSAAVLTVANNGALEVLAYITEQDRTDVRIGDKATFDNGAAGVVTSVAPALDPLTKKIEVRIGINSGGDKLVNGQSVTTTLTRHVLPATAQLSASKLSIPIAAIKVGADNNVSVFSVNDDGTLEAHAVVLGELQGDRVVIASGLTPEMLIVTDARGLRAGQKVLLK